MEDNIATPVEYCHVTGKVKFDKRTAQTAANKRYRDAHVMLRIYQCQHCPAWHLTSREPMLGKKIYHNDKEYKGKNNKGGKRRAGRNRNFREIYS